MAAIGLLVLLAAGCSGASTGSKAPSTTASPSAAPAGETPSPAPKVEAPVPAESNPPGDIPDNLAFVPYANAAGRYRFTHPEGWAEQVAGTHVLFTDKLNGVTADVGSLTSPPTVPEAQANDVPELRRTQPAFELRSVTTVSAPGGSGVRIVYRRNSTPDAVTGRRYRDEVERYELVSHGREVVIEMYGPVGADNVDAYRTMLASVRIA
jgi:hypothetical protein